MTTSPRPRPSSSRTPTRMARRFARRVTSATSKTHHTLELQGSVHGFTPKCMSFMWANSFTFQTRANIRYAQRAPSQHLSRWKLGTRRCGLQVGSLVGSRHRRQARGICQTGRPFLVSYFFRPVPKRACFLAVRRSLHARWPGQAWCKLIPRGRRGEWRLGPQPVRLDGLQQRLLEQKLT